MVLRESIPRQVDKKSGVSEKEKGVWDSQGENRGLEFSKRRKGQIFFSFVFLSLSHIKCFFFFFFFFKPQTDDYTTNNSV